ncbi:MAG: glycoside hydrolase family 30 protein [Sediminibacterium sp.]|nr:glycoside hydrolase family 30 protein [Sediminibacterium sp.]
MRKKTKWINFVVLAVTTVSCSEQINKENSNAKGVTPILKETISHPVNVYTTAKDTNLRIQLTDKVYPEKAVEPDQTELSIFVDTTHLFQPFIGIGGALTDAAAETFYRLSEEKQNEVINAYYSREKGIGYTLGRTNIHSCDFSSSSYTYIKEHDSLLNSFSIAHDKAFRIPLIKRALEATQSQDGLTLFASPWSPPAWMKSNNNMLHGGKLKPEYYNAWARYYTKFIKSYEKEGIPIWGITLQNEPMAEQTWESCLFTAEEERDFLKNYLGPIMHQEGLKDKKIMVWDHNRDFIFHRANVIFDDSIASKYAWGIAFHWYEDWNGGKQLFNNIKYVKESYPEKNILFTEGCIFPFNTEQLGNWHWGERYGEAMINDFNNGSVGWTDWNILLDETGGPNHVGNLLFAPIHANLKTGTLYYMNSYYYIGHFSKFIRPGARRASCVSSYAALLTTSFVNKDGKVIVIVMNKEDKPLTYKLFFTDKMVKINCPARSIQTLIM